MATGPVESRWDPPIRVVSSRRRRRTVGARMVDGTLEVIVPQWMPEAERRQWAEKMRDRISRQIRRAKPSNASLQERAESLNRRLFRGRLRWRSITWAPTVGRWGSCDSGAQLIHIAERAQGLPEWVLDYIVVHELAHLEVPEHGPKFWEVVNQYALAERARGYLIAVDHRAGGPLDGEPD
jgi:predicted metal-dependent hydrolase